MKEVSLQVNYKTHEENNCYFVEIDVINKSGEIAFFTQLQFLDGDNKPVRPSFYTDNFFSLLPGEKKSITIETGKTNLPTKKQMVVQGWNVKKQVFLLD